MQEEVGSELTVIANTGDDIEALGVHVSPDPDLVTYWLSGEIDEERGWGIRDDAFTVFERLKQLGAPSWFGLSDRDLAACLYRRQFLADGGRQTDAQAQIARGLGVEARVLPMADAPVRTKVLTAAGRRDLQEYLILDGGQPEVLGVELEGIEAAEPSREVLEALRVAEAIVIGPSNPVISIGPILAVPGMTRGDHRLPRPGRRRQPLRRRRRRQGPDRPLHGRPRPPLHRRRRRLALRRADRRDGRRRGRPRPAAERDPDPGGADPDGGSRRPRPPGPDRARLRRDPRSRLEDRPPSSRSSTSTTPSSASPAASRTSAGASWRRRWSPTCWRRSAQARTIERTIVVTGDPIAQGLAAEVGAEVVPDPDRHQPRPRRPGRHRPGRGRGRRVRRPAGRRLPAAGPARARPAADRRPRALRRHRPRPPRARHQRPRPAARRTRSSPPSARAAAPATSPLAREAGIPFGVEELASLGLDLDTPADVIALTRELATRPGRARRTAKVLGI